MAGIIRLRFGFIKGVSHAAHSFALVVEHIELTAFFLGGEVHFGNGFKASVQELIALPQFGINQDYSGPVF
jgi:hypothetical protein